MRLHRSNWLMGAGAIALLGTFWVVAEGQTLGKRRLPGNPTANVSSLPITFAKSPFQLAICQMSEELADEDKNTVYFAPILSTGPDLPAKPTFKFRVFGLRSAEWKEVGSNPAVFEYDNGKVELMWHEGARRFAFVCGQSRSSSRSGCGAEWDGPAIETLFIDVNMFDNEGKQWYYTRTVQFVKSGGVDSVRLPSSNS